MHEVNTLTERPTHLLPPSWWSSSGPESALLAHEDGASTLPLAPCPWLLATCYLVCGYHPVHV